MGEKEITYCVPAEFYEGLKEEYPELVKKEWDGTEVIDGIRFIKSEPVYENRAMRRKKAKDMLKGE